MFRVSWNLLPISSLFGGEMIAFGLILYLFSSIVTSKPYEYVNWYLNIEIHWLYLSLIKWQGLYFPGGYESVPFVRMNYCQSLNTRLFLKWVKKYRPVSVVGVFFFLVKPCNFGLKSREIKIFGITCGDIGFALRKSKGNAGLPG